MKKASKLMLGMMIASIVMWPWGYFDRPYPAFGGESLLVIVSVLGYLVCKYEEASDKKSSSPKGTTTKKNVTKKMTNCQMPWGVS